MLRLVLYEDESKVFSDEFEGAMVIGRSGQNEPPPFARLPLDKETRTKLNLGDNSWKVTFASPQDVEWSRTQVIIEPQKGAASIKLTNGGSQRRFQLADGREVLPGKDCVLSLPVVIDLGSSKVIRLQADVGQLRGLPSATIPPLARKAHPHLPTLAGLPPSTNKKEVIAWLGAATDVLQAAVNSDEFFESAASAAVQMADLDVARLLLYRNGEWQPQAVKQARTVVSELQRPSRRVLNQVLKEKRTLWEVLEGEESQTSLKGVGTIVAAPILDRLGEVIGALYGERRGGASLLARPITEVEAMLVELLARGVAAGLARQKMEDARGALQKELDIGRQIQLGFLPVKLPQSAQWEIGRKFQPAREVSGDFYDVFTISKNHIGLVVADVCDKGLGAALFMALFRSLIRAFAQQGISRDLTGSLVDQQMASRPQGDRHLVTLLVELNVLTTVVLTNNYVADIHGDACMFATLFLGVLDTTSGRIHYINAGHDSPIHIGANGIKGRLRATGPAVGMMPDQDFTVETVTLEPGELLLCYTDGVTEARSPKGELFTEKRLLELVNKPATSAAEILDQVEANVKTHSGGGPPYDDITMLAVYRIPAAKPK